MSWEDAWNAGRIDWDAGGGAPALVEMLDAGELPEGRVLVPGCGSGYDVFELADRGRIAIGIDVSPTAARRFDELRHQRGLSASRASIHVGDFFDYDGGPFDLIFDYTFLCAIDLEMRHRWASKTCELLAENGMLITLIFPIGGDFAYEEGPPYRLSPDLVRGVALPYFTNVEMRAPKASHPGREDREMIGIWRKRS